ncbi:MAG: T9SS type A sorting domain-containing protein [Bacteroidia bacterium]|nr:T9SS type A sorting domain-containing protein [Bacteroidia bacterium]
MKKTLLITFLLLVLQGEFFTQNICLEKLVADSLPMPGMCSFSIGPLADFNNDGFPDIPWSGNYSDEITMQTYFKAGVLAGDGNGGFYEDTIWNSDPLNFVTGDFNEDGNADLMVAKIMNSISFYNGDGTGHFTSSVIVPGALMVAGLVSGDFDGDNHTDFLFSALSPGASLAFVHGNGNGTFAAPVNFTNPQLTQTFYKGDFNNDGLADAVIAGGLFISNGGGAFTIVQTQLPLGLYGTGDFNLDGNLDMIGADSIYLGTGFGTFPTKIVYTLPAGVKPYGKMTDLNSDGILDLLAKRGNDVFDTLMVFTGNGNSTFSSANVNIPLDSLSVLGPVGDLDGNGTTDLVMTVRYAEFENCVSTVYGILNKTANIAFYSTSFCAGDSVQLSVNPGAQTLWSNGDTTSSVFVSTAGNYSVTSTTSNGCTSSDVVTVNQITATTFSDINSTNTFCFYSSPFVLTGGAPWGGVYSGQGVSNGIFDAQAAGVGTHTLTYSYSGPGACIGTDTLQIIVEMCLGLKENNSAETISVYPNPGNGQFTLITNEQEFVVSFYDVMGNKIYSGLNEKSINLISQPSGIYFVRLIAGNKLYSQKIILE